MCTQRGDGKHTYIWIKKPHVQVTIPNEIPTRSRWSRLSLDNPEIHSCYWKSTSELILANLYGTRICHNGLVVSGGMTYKWGMTVPQSRSTPTASNHRTGSAGGKHLGAHLPAENRSWRLLNERTLEEITSSQQAKQLCEYPHKWQRANLEKERKAYLEKSRRAIGDDKCTEHRADVKCTYKCTDLEDDQCDCKSTGEMMRKWSSLDLCRTSAIMSTEAVPNETENDLWTYQIVYHNGNARDSHRMASWAPVETTTKRWLPDCLEWRAQEHSIIQSSTYQRHQLICFTKRLTEMNAERPYWRPISLLGRCWRSLNITTDVHHVRATGCKRWCHISRMAYKAMNEGLESANAFENIWYEWPFHEKLTR